VLLPTAAHADLAEQVNLAQAKVLVAGKYTGAPSMKNILQEAVMPAFAGMTSGGNEENGQLTPPAHGGSLAPTKQHLLGGQHA
jgi:hypothetical protein